MSEMIERVAKALYAREKMRAESMERIANHGGEGPWVTLLLPYESQNEIYRDLARASIEAMREPPDGMLEAADPEGLVETDFASHWRDMIDEALK